MLHTLPLGHVPGTVSDLHSYHKLCSALLFSSQDILTPSHEDEHSFVSMGPPKHKHLAHIILTAPFSIHCPSCPQSVHTGPGAGHSVLSSPFPFLAVGYPHFWFSICFGPKCSTPQDPHLTQPSLHTLHPSTHTAFIHVPPCHPPKATQVLVARHHSGA